MEFICYADWTQLPDSADRLFSQAAAESIFFSRTWFECLIRHRPASSENVVLACVVEDTHVLAILPLEQREGGHYYALTNLYSSLYTLLLAKQAPRAVYACLAKGLISLPFSLLHLGPIGEDDGQLQCLQQTMESMGISCQRRFGFYNWVQPTQGQTFDDYLQSRSSRVRNTIARKSRKLEREYGYRVQLYQDHDEQALQDYHTVYQHSWKANEQYGDFIADLAWQLSQQGWLRLAILYTDERPIAAQFWFVVHGKASIFKLVYDEDWKHYSPGTILTQHLLAHVIDTDKVQEIDFLTGNDAYKQDWMSQRRERYGLYCINKAKPVERRDRISKWFEQLFNRSWRSH